MGVEILNSINEIGDLYKQSGTNFGDGLRSGNFNFIQGNRTFAPGVDTTDLQFYSPGVTSNPALDEPILTYSVADGSPGRYFIPLTPLESFYTYQLENNKLVSIGIVSYRKEIDGSLTPLRTAKNYCERLIQLACDQPFTDFVISGYTMYDEKIVFSGNSFVEDVLNISSNFGAPLAAISSISFVATPPFTMNVFVIPGMGLPYTDWGNPQNLILFSTSGNPTELKPFIFGLLSPGVFVLRNNFQYTAGNQNTGSRRPFVSSTGSDTGWLGGTQMFSIQNINPGLFEPNDPNGNPTYSPTNFNSVDLNDVTTLRGPTPYSEGWTDWQG